MEEKIEELESEEQAKKEEIEEMKERKHNNFHPLKNKKRFILLIIINILVFGVIIVYAFVKNEENYQWDDKPIIYIYPKEETKVKITVSNPEKFTITYPKYENGWEVTAKEDGTLIDNNNKEYYALYWEGKEKKNNFIKKDGFVIEGKDTSTFLEEKLKVLGLNNKEANEFIIYWLPKLEKNPFNYIRFQTMEEINKTMKLNIEPTPDTLIRVMMEYKPLKKEIKVKEQILETVERQGYTVVEWGGTEV